MNDLYLRFELGMVLLLSRRYLDLTLKSLPGRESMPSRR